MSAQRRTSLAIRGIARYASEGPKQVSTVMTSDANDKAAGIKALQSLINAVPTDPQRAANDEERAFSDFITEKLVDANAPEALIDVISEIAAKIYGKYDMTSPADIVILNNKLTYLIDIANTREDNNAPLSKSMRQQVLDVMRSKL
ncbi:hypothetical protein [Loktanella sp. R86503]|uniref:hypothetical protein n=1 Tax=Loktanella sp. R86503 TaxID=3093847 RepID=UPI0036DB9B0F